MPDYALSATVALPYHDAVELARATLADRALGLEPSIGVLLPCNDALAPVADEVRGRLGAVLAAVRAAA